MAEIRRVVVTGLGVVSPVGSTLDSFWAAIQAGENGIGHDRFRGWTDTLAGDACAPRRRDRQDCRKTRKSRPAAPSGRAVASVMTPSR